MITPEAGGLESRIVMDAMGYALSRATDDVAETIRWFQAEGFVLASVAARGESFGNVLVEFERAGVRATIVRDRSQWAIDIASPGETSLGLHIWLTAMRGTRAETGPRRPFGEPLPEQLPEGESWRVVVPAVIRWINAADRSVEIAAAGKDWGRAMREHFAVSRESRPK